MARYSYESTRSGLWRKLKPEGRRMRWTPTPAEDALWQVLRKRKLGVRFRRQHAIDRFIADFVCLPAKLIVEVDGEMHDAQSGRDEQRDGILEAAGYEVVRFKNAEVFGDLERVLAEIAKRLNARINIPSPSERGGTPKV